MPQNIAKVPAGLLDLLGSRSMGENPRQLSDTVVGTVELLDLYSLQSYNLLVGGMSGDLAAGFNAMNTGDSLIVPVGEVWRLFLAATQFLAGAAESVDAAPAFRYQNQTVHLAPPITAGGAAAVTKWQTFSPGQPLWLPAGAELGVVANNITGTTQGSLRVLVAQFQV